MRIIRLSIFVITMLSLMLGYGVQRFGSTPKPDEHALLKQMAPESRFSPKQGTPPVYLGEDGAMAFNTRDIAPHVRGYAGPIVVLLVMNRDGRITGLKIIEHHETINYVHYMETPAYLAQFIGKLVSEPLEVDNDIDGISRATVSVKALAAAVKESSRAVASNHLGMQFRPDEGRGNQEMKWLWHALLFSTASTGYVLTRRRAFRNLRDAILVAGILILGLYLSSPFSILHVFNLALMRPGSSLLWLAIFITTLFSVFIAGRFYCGWLCPFGALSEFIGRLPVRKWNIPAETDDRWRTVKYLFLGLTIVLVLVSGRVDFGNFETYVTLFSFHGNTLTWALVGIALVANLRVKRFWCRYLCPVAALTGILSRQTKGYPSSSDCPMGNKPGPHLSECIRCNRCRHHRVSVS